MYIGPVGFNQIFFLTRSHLQLRYNYFFLLEGLLQNTSFNLFQRIRVMRKVRINYIEATHSFRMRVFPRYRCLVFRVADFTINYSICFTVEVDTEVVPVCIFISKLEAECLYELISNCVTPLHRQATAAGCSWVLLSSRLRNSAGRLQRLLIQPDC